MKPPITKEGRQILAALASLAVVATFYFLGQAALVAAALIYLLLGLLLVVREKDKQGNWLMGSLRLNAFLAQGLRSATGLLLTFVFMVALFGWFADGVSTRQGLMALGALFLAIGTVVWSHWLAPHSQGEVNDDQRKVLVSGLSVIKRKDIEELRDISSLADLEAAIKEDGKGSALSENKLVPVLAALACFPRIEQAKLITFQGTLVDDVRFEDVKLIINSLFKHVREVNELDLSGVDRNDASEIYDQLQDAHYLDKLPDQQALFAITSGTAALTAALTLLALRGRALPIYYRRVAHNDTPLAQRIIKFRNWNAQRASFVLRDMLDTLSEA